MVSVLLTDRADPSISGGTVSFGALDAANQGALYRAQGGALTRIIGAGDLLDSKVVSGVGVRRGASNGNAFAFYATFTDGSQGIFLATEAVPADVFLHKSGASLVLNGVAPTAATPAAQDSATLKFSGGNPWKAIGTWSAPATFTAGTLDSLSPLHAWLGLKTTDDNGTRFDVRAEVLKNAPWWARAKSCASRGWCVILRSCWTSACRSDRSHRQRSTERLTSSR